VEGFIPFIGPMEGICDGGVVMGGDVIGTESGHSRRGGHPVGVTVEGDVGEGTGVSLITTGSEILPPVNES